MNGSDSAKFLNDLFDRFSDSDGLLRDHGLTSMLMQNGFDRELEASVVRRAQWLTEHYGSVCLTREDFELLLDGGGRADIYKGDRRGVKPLEPVRMILGDVPSKDTAMLQAARLGLEIENDVRIATDRINKLKLPVSSRLVTLPIIPDVPMIEQTQAEKQESSDEDELKGMPLL